MNNLSRMEELVGLLEKEQTLTDSEFSEFFDILADSCGEDADRRVQIREEIPAARCTHEEAILYAAARSAREKYYGSDVYLRGLIEFTNYCRNDCKYCGIRRSNRNVQRYRLGKEQILLCFRCAWQDLSLRIPFPKTVLLPVVSARLKTASPS